MLHGIMKPFIAFFLVQVQIQLIFVYAAHASKPASPQSSILPNSCQFILSPSSASASITRLNPDGIVELTIIESPWQVRTTPSAPKNNSIANVAALSNERLVALTEQDTVILFDRETGSKHSLNARLTPSGTSPDTIIHDLIATDSQSSYIAGVGRSQIQLWDAENGLPLARLEHEGALVGSVAILGGGRHIVAVTENTRQLLIWDVADLSHIRKTVGAATDLVAGGLAAAPGKSYFLALQSSGDIAAFNLSDGRWLGNIEANNVASLACQTLSKDGKFRAAVDKNGALIVENVGTRAVVFNEKLPFDVALSTQLFFSPNSRFLVAAQNKDLWVHDFSTNSTLKAGAPFDIGRPLQDRGISFSPDGKRLFTISQNGELLEWDLAAAFATPSTPR